MATTVLPRARTQVPWQDGVISSANISNLHATRWGRGTIQDVAFLPDGGSFIIGTASGIATFNMQHPDDAPLWLLFDTPQVYDRLQVSADGQRLLLSHYDETQVRSLVDGLIVEDEPVDIWGGSPYLDPEGHEAVVTSPDGTVQFRGGLAYIGWEEDSISARNTEETAYGRLYSADSDELLYEFRDEPQYITMRDRSRPEACDIDYFSFCGNALMDLVMAPYRAMFSSSGRTLGVLYRVESLGSPSRFSVLRLYRSSDGELLSIHGNFTDNVETFAFAPNRDLLLIAFADGRFEMWDSAAQALQYTKTYFVSPEADMAYSADGRHLIVTRRTSVDVYDANTGVRMQSYSASSNAVSPGDDLLAIGEEDGRVRIRNITTGEALLTIDAHGGPVYSLAFSPDSRSILSAGEDCSVRTWAIPSGIFLNRLKNVVVNAIDDMDPSLASRVLFHYTEYVPGWDLVVGFGSWGTVAGWRASTGEPVYVVESEPLETYMGMYTLDPHFPRAFGTDPGKGVMYIDGLVYDLRNGAKIGPYESPAGHVPECGSDGPITPDGGLLFTRGYGQYEGSICVLDAKDLSLRHLIPVIPGPEETEGLLGWPRLSPDGGQLSIVTGEGVIYVFEVSS